MRTELPLPAVLALSVLLWSAADAAAGPYRVTVPVQGLTSKDIPRLLAAFDSDLRGQLFKVKERGGVLDFHVDPRVRVRLSEVVAAAEGAGLSVDPGSCVLAAQGIGLELSGGDARSEAEVDELLRSFPGGRIRVGGRFAEGERHLLVVRLVDQVDYSELRDHLAEANMTLVDIVWGHWDLMWGIHFEERLPHDMGLDPKE